MASTRWQPTAPLLAALLRSRSKVPSFLSPARSWPSASASPVLPSLDAASKLGYNEHIEIGSRDREPILFLGNLALLPSAKPQKRQSQTERRISPRLRQERVMNRPVPNPRRQRSEAEPRLIVDQVSL